MRRIVRWTVLQFLLTKVRVSQDVIFQLEKRKKRVLLSMSTVTVIHCWSAPRSRSTALLYAFEARDDCIGIDEPLYREYLISKGKSVTRPYLQALISGIPPEDTPPEEEYKWKRELLSLTERISEAAKKLKTGVIFCKHIANRHRFHLNPKKLPPR